MTRLSLAVVLCVAAACGGDDDGVGSASYDTVRDQVIAVAEAGCDWSVECQLTEDRDECVSNVVALYCDEEDCNAEPTASADAVNACINAFSDLGCENPNQPPQCADIPPF